MSACNGRTEEPQAPSEPDAVGSEIIIYQTDSTEWRIKIFKEHILYSEVASITLPAPWVLPTREDAAVLRLLEYPHEERFVTCDGYTFGMPIASVSKAGAKTKYSVLGLHKRRTTIIIEW
ncbi:MAG: hypothetical protein IKM83_04275 [Paludibacteraceae bacterium]|nr:hypothetical protein [Paludibacteraceae bacterium]